MSKLKRALGLMSGTSMDGIDVALLETDGDRALRHGPAASTPYPPEIKVKLRARPEAGARPQGPRRSAGRPARAGSER